jgi:MFS superfamily sulfate permease-like transporter
MLKRGEFLAWVNGSVALGALLAAVCLSVVVSLKRRWQALLALCCLVLAEGVEAAWPLHSSTHGLASLFRWRYGHVQDFNGLTETLSQMWPYLAAVYLVGVAARDMRRAASRISL